MPARSGTSLPHQVLHGPLSAVAGRTHLRSADQHKLFVPRTSTSTFGARAFSSSSPLSWNALPPAAPWSSHLHQHLQTILENSSFQQQFWLTVCYCRSVHLLVFFSSVTARAFVTVSVCLASVYVYLLTYLLVHLRCFVVICLTSFFVFNTVLCFLVCSLTVCLSTEEVSLTACVSFPCVVYFCLISHLKNRYAFSVCSFWGLRSQTPCLPPLSKFLATSLQVARLWPVEVVVRRQPPIRRWRSHTHTTSCLLLLRSVVECANWLVRLREDTDRTLYWLIDWLTNQHRPVTCRPGSRTEMLVGLKPA